MATNAAPQPAGEHPLAPLVSSTEHLIQAQDASPDVAQSSDQLPPLVASAAPAVPVPSEDDGIVKPRRDIWLERLVLDIYEYRGLHELGIFVVFFLISSFFLYSQWGTTAASFKTEVVSSFTNYDFGNDWEASTLDGIDTMTDAYQYMTGYLQNIINRTEALNISARDTDIVYIGENAALRYARLVALFDGCEVRKMRTAYDRFNVTTTTSCWTDARKYPPYDYDLVSFLAPATSKWVLLDDCRDKWCFPAGAKDKKQGWFTTQILGPTTPRSEVLTRLSSEVEGGDALAQYGRVIAKYAVALQLGILAEDRQGRDAAVFTLTVRMRGPSKRLTKRVGTWSVNNPDHLTDRLQTSFTAYQIIFFLMSLYYIWQEFRKWRLCWLQHRSMSFYFRYWWNWTQIISHILNVVWIVWCWTLQASTVDTWPLNLVDYAKVERDADEYTLYLYFGIIVNLVLGVCMCRYMRIHMGLRAFYQVFVDAGRSLLDFGVFVLYIILVLGSATFAFFQISGGNEYFITFSNGLSAMARLPFQFLDYEQFHNYGLGLGDWSWAVTGLFWLTVVFLILFTQNTLLAIFNLAYMNARKKSLKVELSFISLVINRIAFMFIYYGIRIYQLGTSFQKARMREAPVVLTTPKRKDEDQGSDAGTSPIQAKYEPATGEEDDVVVVEEVRENFFVRWWKLWRDERYFMAEMILRKFQDPDNSIRNHPRQLLYCRWCIATLTEMQALAALYTDYATLKLQDTRNEDERPVWISLGGHRRLRTSAPSTTRSANPFNSFATLRRWTSTATVPTSDAEKHREYEEFAAIVPAWSSHFNEERLVALLRMLASKRRSLHFDSRLMRLLFWGSPFDALSVLEMDAPVDLAVEDAEAGPHKDIALANTEEGLPNGRVIDEQLARTISNVIMQVYVNTSKPIRDVDGDGVDDEEDDPAELLRRFKKMYTRDRGTDKAELKDIKDTVDRKLSEVIEDMHQLMDTLLRHPELRLR